MERAVWVCCSSGSGSSEMWTHSGMVTVPPSRSAMITSSYEEKNHFIPLDWITCSCDLKCNKYTLNRKSQSYLVMNWKMYSQKKHQFPQIRCLNFIFCCNFFCIFCQSAGRVMSQILLPYVGFCIRQYVIVIKHLSKNCCVCLKRFGCVKGSQTNAYVYC